MRKVFIICVLILFSFTIANAGDWSTTIYGCKLSRASLGDTMAGNAEYEDSYLAAVAVSKEVALLWHDRIQFEAEGQVVKHFGDQDHWEVNAVPVVLRWLPFPWDNYVDTSVAAGAGVSYAFEQPKIEAIGDSDSPKFLGYLVFEVGVSIKQLPDWTLVTRLHHRSGAGGTFGGKHDASNSVGFGVRYNF